MFSLVESLGLSSIYILLVLKVNDYASLFQLGRVIEKK